MTKWFRFSELSQLEPHFFTITHPKSETKMRIFPRIVFVLAAAFISFRSVVAEDDVKVGIATHLILARDE